MNSRVRRLPSGERAVANLVRLAQGVSTDALSAREKRGFLRLEEELARGRARSDKRGVAQRFAILGFAAAMGLTLLFAWKTREAPHAFEVANASLTPNGYIRPLDREEAKVRFADGSEALLEPGARTKVAEVYENGARVLLEEGKARVRVPHDHETRWIVEAGPYTVQVTGTAFDVEWSPPGERLDLWLHKGSLLLTGPLASHGLLMQTGQHLVAHLRENRILLDGMPWMATDLASTEVPSEAVPLDVAPTNERGTRSGKHARNGDSARSPNSSLADETRTLSWAKRLANGDFDGIIADAERRGIDNVLAKSTKADVSALADAARYARRTELARRALLATRERFATSSQGKEAAFFLGGLAEADASSMSSALEWYDRYLTERPQGSYASQALGRKMILIGKLRGREAARPLAIEYLNRYATGPYARNARNLLETNALR